MENLALNQLGKIVYDYCGLNYLSNLSSLEMKTSKRLSELNMSNLWSYIHYLEEEEAEWEHLVELLTINETYFYREDKQFAVFQQTILPQLKASSMTQPVKVWSAACSTGEEPYSLAMTVMDSGICQPDEVKIMGTDINKRVLNIAKNGTYGKKSLSFRRIPQNWLHQYFVDTATDYKIIEPIKKMVSFDYINLLDANADWKKEEYDVIFCRNVLIYFDEETIKKVVMSFRDALKKGGYLFLGHAETISKLDIGFETIYTDGTFYYRKE